MIIGQARVYVLWFQKEGKLSFAGARDHGRIIARE